MSHTLNLSLKSTIDFLIYNSSSKAVAVQLLARLIAAAKADPASAEAALTSLTRDIEPAEEAEEKEAPLFDQLNVLDREVALYREITGYLCDYGIDEERASALIANYAMTVEERVRSTRFNS